ncbi:MAG: translation elongation factor Ts [Spirochaetia bacterium]|jgi:elongation factor Ts|nr:translation elongation factor Ts [Spirochaetia bacterium]
MEIKAEDVKALREKTGAGMMDCKKALTQAEGDFARAEKILKEQGLAAAAKRSDRATNEGRIFTKVCPGRAAIAELSCETDFVARNADFVKLGEGIVLSIAADKKDPGAPELADAVKDLVATVKENMALRRAEALEYGALGVVVDYVHEGRIGVLVKASADKAEALLDAAVKAFVSDCALHIAAFGPLFLSEKDVSAAYLKEQEEIFTKQAENLGKPANVLQGIVKGKMKKHFSEICFLEQPFVRDEKRSVKQVLADIGRQAGAAISIDAYIYYRVGEDT